MVAWPEQAIAELAGAQRTIVAAEQLLAVGLGRQAIAYRIKNGRLHIVFRGVYSVVSGPLPPLALELAALLACGKGSFISHHSAAYVWGMRKDPPALVEVSVVGRYCGSRRGIRVHRIRTIDRREIQRREGLWISTPARALFEIAQALGPSELANAVGDGIGARVVKPAEVEAVLARNRGRAGAARLAAVIGDEDALAITRSRAERAFLKLIRDSGLPRPETNVKLGRYEPDFVWRQQRLIVELDSYGFHGGPDGFQRDHDRDLVYRTAGFDVLRPTRQHVVYEPARVLVLVAQALARRDSAD
ncbi:MAG: DUF559 domain-containing protein [Solirubrobacterales bacterium]|nr:DUF559 domain-containing protein [Solirubrobacterales bacterium]MBV9943446.1 DUF559 domain-containing protein [Solirubrobacterales bacterium]